MTVPFDLTICGVLELGGIDRRRITHAISIWHPDASTDEHIGLVREAFAGSRVHAAVFDDVEHALPGCHPVTAEQVRAVLAFADDLARGHHLLVHCMAGISRSTACAIAILADHLGAGLERAAAETVRDLRRQASPNRLVLAHADELLGRRGALVRACDEVFAAASGPAFNKGWDELGEAGAAPA